MTAQRLVLGFQTEYFPPDSSSNAMLYGHLVDRLTPLFARIDVVCAGPHHGAGDFRTEVAAYNLRVLRRRPPSWRLRRHLATRLVSELWFALRNTVTAFRASREWDVVLSSTPPLVLGAGAAVVARIRHIPFVWWVQDLHPEIAAALGLTSTTSAPFRLLHSIHEWTLKGASIVITVSDAQRQALLEAYPAIDGAKVTILQNPATHEPDTPRTQPRVEQLLISFTGNIGLSQGLDHIIETARHLQDLPVRFLIHGRGQAETQLRTTVEKLHLKNVEFSSYLCDTDYLALLARSDVLLLCLRPGIDRYSFPSKLWTYLAAGKPILACVGPDGAVNDTLAGSRAGIVVEWGDVPSSIGAVHQLLDGRERQIMADAAFRLYRQHSTPDQHAQRVADLLRSIRPPSAESSMRGDHNTRVSTGPT